MNEIIMSFNEILMFGSRRCKLLRSEDLNKTETPVLAEVTKLMQAGYSFNQAIT